MAGAEQSTEFVWKALGPAMVDHREAMQPETCANRAVMDIAFDSRHVWVPGVAASPQPWATYASLCLYGALLSRFLCQYPCPLHTSRLWQLKR